MEEILGQQWEKIEKWDEKVRKMEKWKENDIKNGKKKFYEKGGQKNLTKKRTEKS